MFWDSSAIVPYLVREAASQSMTDLLSRDTSVVIWWATSVECVSALERCRRAGGLSAPRCSEARRRLHELMGKSDIVQACGRLRIRAERLLATHPLRAADALQLAAALVACAEQPHGERFVSLDERLRDAASREGFTVLPEAVTA